MVEPFRSKKKVVRFSDVIFFYELLLTNFLAFIPKIGFTCDCWVGLLKNLFSKHSRSQPSAIWHEIDSTGRQHSLNASAGRSDKKTSLEKRESEIAQTNLVCARVAHFGREQKQKRVRSEREREREMHFVASAAARQGSREYWFDRDPAPRPTPPSPIPTPFCRLNKNIR